MSRNLTIGERPAPGQDAQPAAAWSPTGEPRCVCGATVDAEAARVFGVDGVVPACPACWHSKDRQRRFQTVAACVVAWQDSRTTNCRKPGVEIEADAHPGVVADE